MTGYGVFFFALALAYLMPGPDMMLLLQTGATAGRRTALAVAVGLALARGLHVALAGLGLAALLRTAPLAFDTVRLIGVGYLVWLGIAILRAPSTGSFETEVARQTVLAPLPAARRGLLTNLLNPKALLFCSVLLPQFVHDGGLPPTWQFAALGVELVAVGILFDSLYAMAGGQLGRWLAHHPKAQAAQRWSFATLLIAFGAQLALNS